MLKKENRLRKIGKNIQKRVSTPLFNISIGDNNLKVNRFAFVISKKVDKRATVRNKTRRKVRSIIEEMLDGIPGGKDISLYLKKEAVDISRDEAKQEIQKAFKKNNIYK